MRTLLVLMLLATAARADQPAPTFGSNQRFTEVGGAAVYGAVCAGCHMPDGRGAMGAGAYPALAGDGRLAASSYAIDRVLRGKGAMPPLGRMLTDVQIAAVVDYIRTNFGNDFTPGPTSSNVASAR